MTSRLAIVSMQARGQGFEQIREAGCILVCPVLLVTGDVY